jgi:hypothetical protein
MANQLSGQTGASQRCYRKHERHATFARVKIGENQFSAFLAAQATRLTSSSTAIFTFLKKNTADRIRKATSTGQLS